MPSMTEFSPPDRGRPDACPGALQVHAAADGGLARVRVPGGQLTTSQVRALAEASEELGHPGLELTSRANVQVRGLRPGGERDLADRVASAGLLPSITHERVRNIIASPCSGCDGVGFVDARRLARDVDSALCAAPRLAELSGRFLFTVDDGRGDLAELGADIGAIAVGEDEVAVLIGGTDHGVRVRPHAVADAIVSAAEAFLAERERRRCRAWRVTELGDTSGVAASLRAGTTADGAVSDVTPVPAPAPPAHRQPQVGEVARRPGEVVLAVGAPLGRLSPAHLHSIIRAAEAASGRVRLTPWRTVVLPGLAPEDAASWLSHLGRSGLIVEPSSAWAGTTACTGSPGCAKALADVRGDAARVLAESPDGDHAGGGDTPVHWVGCERRCGTPRGRVVEVLATESGYRVAGDPAGTWSTGELAGTIARARKTEDHTVNEDNP